MAKDPKLGDWDAFEKFVNQGGDAEYTPTKAGIFTSSRRQSGVSNAPDSSYDEGYLPGMDIDQLRQSNQTSWDVFSNAMTNVATAVPLEMAESTGYLLNQLFNDNENDFLEAQNEFSSKMRDMKETVQEGNPIYADKEDQNFNPFNAMSWATNAPSIGSTLSLLIPGATAGMLGLKLAGKAGKMMKLGTRSQSLLGAAGQTAAATTTSRYMENMLEGYGTFQESLTAGLIDKGVDPSNVSSVAEALMNNPEEAMTGDYKDVFNTAADNAAKTVKWNWGMAMQDALQFGLLFGNIKMPKLKTVPGSTLTTKTGKFGNYTKDALNKSGNLLTQAASEGLEEGYQYAVSKEAQRSEEMFAEGFSDRLSEYLSEEEMQSAMMMGAVMGAGFQAAGPGIQKLTSYASKHWQDMDAAKDLYNYTKATKDATMKGGHTVRRNYLDSAGDADYGSLAGLVKKLDNIPTEQESEMQDAVIQTVKGLNEEAGYLKSQGLAKEQIADILEQSYIEQISGFAEDQHNSLAEEIADQGVKQRKLKIDDSTNERESFLKNAKIKAIDKLLKKYPSKKRGKETEAIQKELADLESLKTSLETEAKELGKIPSNIELLNTKATEAYTASLFNRMAKADARDKINKSTKGDTDYIKSRDQANERAKKTIVKEQTDIAKSATTEAQIDAAKQSAKDLTGSTDEVDNAIKKKAQENPFTDKELAPDTTLPRQEAQDAFKGRLKDHYNKPENLAGFVTDRAGLEEGLGQSLPKDVDTFSTTISRMMTDNAEQKEVITSYYKKNANKQKVRPNKTKAKPEITPGEEVVGNNFIYDSAFSIPIVAAQFKWNRTGATANTPIRNEETGYYEPYVQANPDDPTVDYSLIDSQEFAPQAKYDEDGNYTPGWKAVIKINPNRTWNRNASDDSRAMEIYTVNPDTQENVYIGSLQMSSNGNSRVQALREAINEEYKNSNTGEVFTSSIEFEIAGKKTGNIYSLDATKPENRRTPKEALKGKPFHMITTLVKDNKEVDFTGYSNIEDPTIEDRINELDKYKHATAGNDPNSDIYLGGKLFMLLKGANGQALTAQLFTRKLAEIPAKREEVDKLVDELYDVGEFDKQIEASNRISNLLHVGHDSSDRHILVMPDSNIEFKRGKIGSEDEAKPITREDLKEALADTIFYIDAQRLNYLDYNDSVNEYLTTDLNPDYPIHSSGFSIKPVSPVTGTVNEATVEKPIVAEEDPASRDNPEANAAFLNFAVAGMETASEESTNNEDDWMDDDDIDIPDDLNTKVPKPSTINIVTPTTENIAAERKRVSRILGNSKAVTEFTDETQLPADEAVLDMVQRVRSKGEFIEGLFTNAGIYLRSAGTVGRGYHEAFHAVFTLALSPAERITLFNEVKKDLDNPSMTMLEAEEYLAEEFRRESLALEDKTISQKIREVLSRLWSMVKGFFNKESKISAKKLFGDMNRGLYAGKVNFNRNVTSFVKPMTSDVPFTTFEAIEFREVIFDQYNQLMDQLRNDPKLQGAKYGSFTDAQLIYRAANAEGFIKDEKTMPIQYLQDTLLIRTMAMRKLMKNSGYSDTAALYGKAIRAYFGDNSNVEKTEEGKRTVLKSTPLFNTALINLKRFGLEVNLATKDLVGNQQDNHQEPGTDEGDKIYEKESWLRDRGTEDNRQKVRDSLRRSLANIPKYGINGEMPGESIYAVTPKEDPSYLMSFLERTISSSSSQEVMMKKLKKLQKQHRWAKDVYDTAVADSNYKKDLWLGIGGMWQVDYFGVSRSGNTYNSNRRDIGVIIKEDVIAIFLNPLNPLVNETNLELNKNKAAEFTIEYNTYGTIFKSLLPQLKTTELTGVQYGGKNGEQIIEELSKLLQNNYINFNKDILIQLYKNKGAQGFYDLMFNLNNKSVMNLVDYMNMGKNPFIGIDVNPNYRQIWQNVGRDFKSAWPEQPQQVFINMKGKRNFALTEPTYLSQMIAKIKEGKGSFIKEYFRGTLAAAPIREDLGTMIDEIGIKVLDGANINGNKKSYKDLTKKDLAKVFIDAFINRKEAYGLFPIPIPADSSMLPFINYKKINDVEKLYDKLVQVAIMEEKRMNNFEANPDLKNIKHYNNKANSFQYLKFLNGKVSNIAGNETEVKKLIKEWAKKEISDLGDYYRTHYADQYGNKQIESYFLNSLYYGTQTIAIFSKDPSFYKSIGDAFKRYKQLGAPGMTPGGVVNPLIKAVVLADEEIPNITAELGTEEHKFQTERLEKILSMAYQDNTIQSLWKEDNNTSDGFTYISPETYRKFADSVGKWTPQQEASYQKRYDDNQSLSNNELRDLFPPIKPYYFSQYDYGGELVPIQMKNSVHVITEELIAMNPSNRKLAKVWEIMNSEIDGTKIGIVTFDSTVKVGIAEKNPNALFKTLSDIEEDGLENAVIDMDMNDLRWQQDNPPHWFNYQVRFGSQLRNLIMSGINPTDSYTINDSEVTGKEIKTLYFDIIESILEEDLTDLQKDINIEEANYDSLLDKVVAMAFDRDMPASTIEALGQKTLDSQGREIPNLNGAAVKDVTQSLVASAYKRNVWTQKMPGGQFVNVSSYGVSDTLEYKIGENNVIHMEAYLPAWTKNLLDNQGKIDSDVLEIIGYRIPTEDRYSIFNIKVKGFLDQSAGGSIILPKEVTKIAGLDFDIDKLFVFTPNHEVQEDRVKKVNFDYTKGESGYNLDQPKKAKQNALIDIMRSILTSPHHTESVLGTGNFVRLENNGLAMLLRDTYSQKSLKELLNMKNKKQELTVLEEDRFNAASVLTQLEFHERNVTGEALIGVTANHRIHAVKSEDTDLKMSEAIKMNGKMLQQLNITELDGEIIAKNLAEFSAAMVDNGKNPIAPFINFNTHTADTAMLMIRLGLPIEYVVAFLTTPTVRALADKAINEDQSFSSVINTSIGSKRGSVTDHTIEDLFNSKDTGDIEIIKTLKVLQQTGAELSRLISATKTDASPAASNTSDMFIQMRTIEDAINDNFYMLSNTSDFFKGKEGARLSSMFYDKGHMPVHEIFKVFYPELRDTFYDTKAYIEGKMPKFRYLNKDSVKKIDDHIMSYWISKHPSLSSIKDRGAFLESTYHKLIEAKIKADPKYLPLLEKIKPISRANEKGRLINKLMFDRTSFDDTNIDLIREVWYGMFTEGDAYHSGLAKDLFKYVLLTSQFNSTPGTILPLVHPKMFLVGDNNSIESVRSELLQDGASVVESGFYDQFVRNTFNEKGSIVPSVEVSQIEDRKVNKDRLRIARSQGLFSRGDQPVPYVRMYKAGKWQLFRLEYSTKGMGYYVRENVLGIDNFAYEYRFDEFDIVSTMTEPMKITESDGRLPDNGDMDTQYGNMTSEDQQIIESEAFQTFLTNERVANPGLSLEEALDYYKKCGG